jgi:ABC-type lipoprotein release transport system permease subunit
MRNAKFIFIVGGITSGVFGLISGLSWGFGLLFFSRHYSELIVVQEVFQTLFMATAVGTVLVGVGFILDDVLPTIKK